MNRFNKFYLELQKRNPKLKIDYKNKSTFMKIIGLLLFFNKGFMTHFITTIGNTVYFPNEEFIKQKPVDATIVLAHEFMHTQDAERTGHLLYSLSYLMPQILVLLIIPLAFLIGWYSLFTLMLIAPIPAYWRKNIEYRGYSVTLFGYYLRMIELDYPKEEINANLNKIADEITSKFFNGAAYYFMWPFDLKKKLSKTIKDIETGDILKSDDVFIQVREAFNESKQV